MKLLFLILLPFFPFAQATTYEPGDSTWLTSSDTAKVKVYKEKPNDTLFIGRIKSFYLINMEILGIDTVYYNKPIFREKYDTIGPFWKQVSDTTPGYNPVMAMQVYEVRIYKNEWIMVDPNIKSANGTTTLLAPYRENILQPYHFAWLDIKKKPLKFKVW